MSPSAFDWPDSVGRVLGEPEKCNMQGPAPWKTDKRRGKIRKTKGLAQSPGKKSFSIVPTEGLERHLIGPGVSGPCLHLGSGVEEGAGRPSGGHSSDIKSEAGWPQSQDRVPLPDRDTVVADPVAQHMPFRGGWGYGVGVSVLEAMQLQMAQLPFLPHSKIRGWL